MRLSAGVLCCAFLLASCGGGGSGPIAAVPQPANANGGSNQSTSIAQAYEVVDLGAYAYPNAINNHNEVVGEANFNGPTQPVEAFLFTGGSLHNLGTLPGGTESIANGINDSGTIIGTSYGPGLSRTAALFYSNAAPQSLGTGNGVSSFGNAVNNNGELVGTVLASDDGESSSCYGPIAIFDGHGGAQQYGSNALAVAVNSSGTILYDVYYGISLNCREGTISAALYPSNTAVPFPSNENNDYGGSGAYGLNDNGDVVGFYRDVDFNTAGFYYHNGTSIELLPQGYSGEGTGFVAYAVNNSGVVGGTAGPAPNQDPQAYVWVNGTFTNMNTRLAADCRQWTLTRISAINDLGVMAGQALLNNEEHGVLLIPQP